MMVCQRLCYLRNTFHFIIIFFSTYFVINGSAAASLRVRISLRNRNTSLTEAHCDLLSLSLLSTGEEIFLKETSGQIIQTQPTNQLEIQDFKTCIYQEMYINESRLLALSASRASLRIFLSIGQNKHFLENFNLSSALQFIELVDYTLSFHGRNGYCGVNLNPFPRRNNLFPTAANVAVLDYYVELYLVVDYSLYRKYMNGTRSYVYQVVNTANLLYRPLGIHLLLVGLEIWSAGDRMVITTDSTETLVNLILYRTTVTQKHDVIHLLSNAAFSWNSLNDFGLSYDATLCRFPTSAGLLTDNLSETAWRTGQIMAHELGHSFGLQHDDGTCSCSPESSCIMNASSFTVLTRWSDCSLATLNKNLNFVKVLRCLEDTSMSEVTNTVSTCGNGVVDKNEDCDPVLASVNCCDPKTCKFTSGAQCASGRCCDKSTCRLLVAGTMCRSAANECDLPEFCNGETENCPENRYVISGVPCDNKKAYCYNGSCGSSDQQCRSIMGGNSASNYACFEPLMRMPGWTGCRYTYVSMSSTIVNYLTNSCSPSEYYCGRLFCTNYTQSSKFYPIFSDTYSDCNYMYYDMNMTSYRDPGMVPNGANCGTNKWCVNTTCQTLPTLPNQCSCNNSGDCNDLGHCHCNSGSSGTNCSIPSGCGGSIDSGPACINIRASDASTTVTSLLMATTPKTCPVNYCSNYGSCNVNTNGLLCSSDQEYCCRCQADDLPPRCETQAVVAIQVQMTRSIQFIPAYEDKNSVEFASFETDMCFVIRESLRSSFNISQISCQCLQITNGSAIGQMLIKGTSALQTVTTDVVDLTNEYCSTNSTISQCIVTTASVPDPKYKYDSCQNATDCPPSTATCVSNGLTKYVCTCKPGFYEDKSLSGKAKVCTGKCYPNTTQCLDHGVCQEIRGSLIKCKCYDGYSGDKCEYGVSTTDIIIATVASTVVCIIIVVLAIVAAKVIGRQPLVVPTGVETRKETYTTNDAQAEQSETDSDTYDIPEVPSDFYISYSPYVY